MSAKFISWCFVFCFAYEAICLVSGEDLNFEPTNLGEELGGKGGPFRLIENMINEAKGIVLGILRGDLSDEIKKEINRQNVDLTGSYDGVSKLVKKCLKKAKNKEGKELVRKCFDQAVRERQNEELQEQEAQPTMQSCLQEAMLDASQAAAPLLTEAQERGAVFREMVQKTANGLANCRAEERPFQCMIAVWGEAQQNMTAMRDQVIDMMLVARDIYIQYTDDVRRCITPVEEVDPEDEDLVEENGTKKDPTPANPTKSTPPYFDPVEEGKTNPPSKFPATE